MLELARGLSPTAMAALAQLEARTVAADGGRLKLEWGSLNTRSGQSVEDLLWWNGDQLLGFLGLYSFSTPTEVVGMVDPQARRHGIGTALLDAAITLCRKRGLDELLLVVPRTSTAGRALAIKRGGTPDHSEHALVLTTAPANGPNDPRTQLRVADTADIPVIASLLAAGFGFAPSDRQDIISEVDAQTLVISRDDRPVGTIRINRNGTTAGIYGFVIDPQYQGQGIGRDALRRICTQLRDEGLDRIGLEVEVKNENALKLYTSLGFASVTTEDYYRLHTR